MWERQLSQTLKRTLSHGPNNKNKTGHRLRWRPPKRDEGKMNHKTKSLNALVSQGEASTVTEADLAIINGGFAFTPLEASGVYVRKMYVCHTAIDRSKDRFTPEVLDHLATTLVGKGFNDGHPQQGRTTSETVIGRVFKTETVEETLEAARQRTGEDLRLPDGGTTVKWVVAHFYIPLIDEYSQTITKKIEAGILTYASIGFEWKSPTRVNDDNGNVLYYEYRELVEAHEVSLVWLGDQTGAAITKSADKDETQPDEKETPKMKQINKALGLDPAASEESAMAALDAERQKAATDASIVKALGVTTEDGAKALMADASAGKAYRVSLCKQVTDAENKLGRFPDAEQKAAREKALSGRSIADLETEAKWAEKQVEEKFPTGGTKGLTGGGNGSEGVKGGKSFEDTVNEIKQKTSGIPHAKAVAQAAKENPEGYTAYMNPTAN